MTNVISLPARKERARYTFLHGSRPEGVVLYDEHPNGGSLKCQSWHDTDPAGGVQCNAFDLVRLHLFSHLDSEEDKAKPVNERPSYHAMCQLALQQPELRQASADSDYALIQALGPLEPAQPVTEKRSRFVFQPASQFAGSLAPREWVVQDIITADAELIALAGASRSGKSFLALDLASAIHRGAPWHGHKSKRQRVAYVCAEGAGDFRYRMCAHARHNNIPLDELFPVLSAAPNVMRREQLNELITAIEQLGGCDDLVLDTMTACAAGADQNDSAAMSLYVEQLREIRRRASVRRIWYIHHSGKDEAKGQRGSTVLIGACDHELWVSRSGDLRSVELTKTKAGQERQLFAFNLRPVVLGRDAEGRDYGSAVVDVVEGFEPRGRRLPDKGTSQRIVFDAIEELDTGEGVLESDILVEVEQKLGGARPDKKFRRAVMALLERQLIYRHGDNLSVHAMPPGVE